ncbi:MAG: hypothetical protein PHO89_01240 [Methylacidiphilaceae bacterium]|nr:hypothetical protein [Candidatus Methylacidiphilaceae bacterium]
MKLLLIPLGFAAVAATMQAAPAPGLASAAPPRAQAVAAPPESQVITQPVVHSYFVGAFIDPSDPNVRHHAHVVDRLEQPSSWNLWPTTVEAVRLGPGVRYTSDPPLDAARAAQDVRLAAVESEHQAYAQRLAAESSEMTARLKDMEKQLAELKSANEQLAQAKKQIRKLRETQETLLEELKKEKAKRHGFLAHD